jgi:hypothetical protein
MQLKADSTLVDQGLADEELIDLRNDSAALFNVEHATTPTPTQNAATDASAPVIDEQTSDHG